jgi:Putative restriction endonuclease
LRLSSQEIRKDCARLHRAHVFGRVAYLCDSATLKAMSRLPVQAPGPFVASQLNSGDSYELSKGHPVHCLPTGRRGSTRNLTGGAALETDPKVVAAGVDLGVTTEPGMLRAPDVAVGPIEDAPGWSTQAPPLAVEYADSGQDEAELQAKVVELLAAGTQYIWVVRLVGERRVEVHEPGKRMRLVTGEGVLSAPGVLQNDVPLAVLYDREAAHDATLRNLLQRRGYRDLEAVRTEGRDEGRDVGRDEGRVVGLQASIVSVLEVRELAIDEASRTRIRDELDIHVLERWLRQAVRARSIAAVFMERPVDASKIQR